MKNLESEDGLVHLPHETYSHTDSWFVANCNLLMTDRYDGSKLLVAALTDKAATCIWCVGERKRS